jgi:hypothetical protein
LGLLGSWCANYGTGLDGAINCSYTLFEQCRATVSGIYGFCTPNPYPGTSYGRGGTWNLTPTSRGFRAGPSTRSGFPHSNCPRMESGLPFVTFSPPKVIRTHRPRIADDFFKQESVRFERARIDMSGSILAGGHNLNLNGTVLVRRDKVCMTAEGPWWACGQRAFIALWGVQSWLTDHRTSATSTSQAFGVSQPACPLTGGISAPPAAPYSTAARKRR